MDQRLSQEEIDGLFRAAQEPRRRRRQAAPRPRTVTRYVFGQTLPIDRRQVRSLVVLHETIAADLSRYLSAFLRSSIKVSRSSQEVISYSDFLQHVSEPAYIASIIIQPPEAVAVLTLDLPVVFPILDLLLGGEGKAETSTRDITEIEEEVLESVVRIICKELETVCHSLLELTLRFDRRQQREQTVRLIPSAERVLSFGFEVGMPETLGKLNLVLPSSTSGRLLRKVAEEAPAQPVRRAAHGPRLQELLQNCTLSSELRLSPIPVRGRDLLALRPGQTLVLQHRVSDPVPLWVAGEELALAFPVRSGQARAAVVERRIPKSLPREEP